MLAPLTTLTTLLLLLSTALALPFDFAFFKTPHWGRSYNSTSTATYVHHPSGIRPSGSFPTGACVTGRPHHEHEEEKRGMYHYRFANGTASHHSYSHHASSGFAHPTGSYSHHARPTGTGFAHPTGTGHHAHAHAHAHAEETGEKTFMSPQGSRFGGARKEIRDAKQWAEWTAHSARPTPTGWARPTGTERPEWAKPTAWFGRYADE
ncbi:hypothetical protein B0A49_09183 [Cryomyces minteri]|uniref:Uncharacterized protein n=1 Tax=Cryomyces minteri TaxID=331657 RepID=A0A4V5NDZ5_9PEZI|nr:hypothetical protein B0A49_09183 [Cryomyces minteri]